MIACTHFLQRIAMWRFVWQFGSLLAIVACLHTFGAFGCGPSTPERPVVLRPAAFQVYSGLAAANTSRRIIAAHSAKNETTTVTVSQAVTVIAKLEPRQRRRVLSALACSVAAPGDAQLHAACLGHTPSLGVARAVAKALESSLSPQQQIRATIDSWIRAASSPSSSASPISSSRRRHKRKLRLPHGDDDPRWWAIAAEPVGSVPVSNVGSPTTAVATARKPAQLNQRKPPPPPPPRSALPIRVVPEHLKGNPAPRWLDAVRPAKDDWKELRRQQWELPPLLAPIVPRSALPACVWERLTTLCAKIYKLSHSVVAGGRWRAEWRRGVRCLHWAKLRATTTPPPGHPSMYIRDDVSDAELASSGGIEVGIMKPTLTEAENAILLEDRCEEMGSIGSHLTIPTPPPGESSLPLEALRRAVGASNEVDDDAGGPRSNNWRLLSLRKKLQAGEPVRVLAIGASNTAMFAPACSDEGCEAQPHEPMEAVRARFDGLAARHGALRDGQPDWLVRLLLTMHKAYPASPLLGVAEAYGGLDPKMVAMCIADFLETSQPFKARHARSRGKASGSGGGGHGHGERTSDELPDLLILDFAIFAGKKPLLNYLSSLEKLLRYLWPHDVAVVLLNMANWCRGPRGIVAWEVMGHAKCQRMLYDRESSRHNLGLAPFPDEWHAQLARLAAHYGHPAVSTFDALQPFVASGQLRVSDFTQDGMHPAYWPAGTDLGQVYIAYIADALTFAIDPRAITKHHTLWNGRRRPLDDRSETTNARALINVTSASSASLIAGAPMPSAMRRDVDDLKGVRCYGWAGRGDLWRGDNRGAWIKSVVSGVSWRGDVKSGWAHTQLEMKHNGSAWVPLAKRSKKPGLTSVSVGDEFRIAVDTALSEASPTATPVVQVTYLQSYEQVGVLKIECVESCKCEPLVVDTLIPTRRFATLNTAISGPVTRAARCVLRFTNVSPRPDPSTLTSRTKIKLVAMAVLSRECKSGQECASRVVAAREPLDIG